MLSKFINREKGKIIVAILFITSVIVYFYASYQLNEVCNSALNCTSSERKGVWLPLLSFGTYAPLILLPFLFLPSHYFKAWAIKVASWALPIALVLVLSESPSSSAMLAFGRDGMVILMALIVANLTLVFILYTYARGHEQYKKIAGYWYFLLLGLTLYATTFLLPVLI